MDTPVPSDPVPAIAPPTSGTGPMADDRWDYDPAEVNPNLDPRMVFEGPDQIPPAPPDNAGEVAKAREVVSVYLNQDLGELPHKTVLCMLRYPDEFYDQVDRFSGCKGVVNDGEPRLWFFDDDKDMDWPRPPGVSEFQLKFGGQVSRGRHRL